MRRWATIESGCQLSPRHRRAELQSVHRLSQIGAFQHQGKMDHPVPAPAAVSRPLNQTRQTQRVFHPDSIQDCDTRYPVRRNVSSTGFVDRFRDRAQKYFRPETPERVHRLVKDACRDRLASPPVIFLRYVCLCGHHSGPQLTSSFSGRVPESCMRNYPQAIPLENSGAETRHVHKLPAVVAPLLSARRNRATFERGDHQSRSPGKPPTK